jgi:hypothetical protein
MSRFMQEFLEQLTPRARAFCSFMLDENGYSLLPDLRRRLLINYSRLTDVESTVLYVLVSLTTPSRNGKAAELKPNPLPLQMSDFATLAHCTEPAAVRAIATFMQAGLVEHVKTQIEGAEERAYIFRIDLFTEEFMVEKFTTQAQRRRFFRLLDRILSPTGEEANA